MCVGRLKVLRFLTVLGVLATQQQVRAAFEARPYFPLRAGNSWSYQDDTLNFTTTVQSSTVTINGIATVVLLDAPTGFANYFTNDNNGLRLHRQFEPDGNITVTFIPPVKFANALTDIGQTVNSSGTASTNFGNFSYTSSYTVQGFENITVVAGAFSALRVAGTITICAGATCEAASQNLFLVRNIGLVKDFGIAAGENYTYELISANVVALSGAVDFDGDGMSDVGIYRDGLWSIIRSSGGANIVESLGGPTHTPVPADYDGDGKTDIAVYLPANGLWSIKRSSDGGTTSVSHGGGSFIPVPGDYDGDGKADIAVYAGGVWSIKRSSDGGNTVTAHGGPGWTPVPGDYDGDGKVDIAVYINGAWSILRSSNSAINVVAHGGPAWEPMPADYDGDGKADVAAYTGGAWSIIRSSDSGNTVVGHGGPSWQPVPADYDGDGKTDIAVHTGGAWAIIQSSTSSIQVVGHGGAPTDVPLN